MPKIPINKYTVGATVLVLGVWYLKRRAGALVDAVNPANPDNVINQGFQSAVGEQNAATFFDHFFGLADLLDPFKSTQEKTYARQVWGIDADYQQLQNDQEVISE